MAGGLLPAVALAQARRAGRMSRPGRRLFARDWGCVYILDKIFEFYPEKARRSLLLRAGRSVSYGREVSHGVPLRAGLRGEVSRGKGGERTQAADEVRMDELGPPCISKGQGREALGRHSVWWGRREASRYSHPVKVYDKILIFTVVQPCPMLLDCA